MYWKMRWFGLTEISPFTCISAIWGQYPVLSHPGFLKTPVGSGCSLTAARSRRSSSWVPWRAGIADDCDILVCWYGGKYSISHSEWSLFSSAVHMLQNQTWVQLPSGSKANLLILGCGEGKCSIYCKAPAKESVILLNSPVSFSKAFFKARWGGGVMVCGQLVHNSLINWWWSNWAVSHYQSLGSSRPGGFHLVSVSASVQKTQEMCIREYYLGPSERS